jgi:biopolymer transport protein ExbD
MKFRAQQRSSSMPEVNLIPMMDVIMTILTFFIIVSMTLTNFQSIDILLPRTQSGVNQQEPPEPLIIGLNQQGQILFEGNSIRGDRLSQQIVTYLQQNPEGVVVLTADQQAPYQEVIQLLGTLKQLGGERVSLAIE